jgi:hypothetical protein
MLRKSISNIVPLKNFRKEKPELLQKLFEVSQQPQIFLPHFTSKAHLGHDVAQTAVA